MHRVVTSGLIGLCSAGMLALTACSQPPAPANASNAVPGAVSPANATAAPANVASATDPSDPGDWTYSTSGKATMACSASADAVMQTGAITFCIGAGDGGDAVATLEMAAGSFACAGGQTCNIGLTMDGGSPMGLTYRLAAGNPHKAVIVDTDDFAVYLGNGVKKLTFALPLAGGATVNAGIDVAHLDLAKAGLSRH